MEILDVLVKSYAYAVEMKRAAASASTWLKSIGRGQTLSDHEIISRDTASTNSTTGDDNDDKNWKSNTEMDKMAVMTLKAAVDGSIVWPKI